MRLKKKPLPAGRIISLSVYIVAIIVSVEFLSFLALTGYSVVASRVGLRDALAARRNELSLAWRKKTTYGDFDPLTQVRLVPGEKYSTYLFVNEHGFIGNGHNDAFLNSFPEKPRGLIRVVLLGGSSAAGSGAAKNSDTIPAILEKMLNENANAGAKRYQVLNFAAAGGYTGAELNKFLMQLIYVDPDIVICLDGFNDAWNAVLEPSRIGIKHGVINWSDYSYSYFELFNGYGRRGSVPVRFFTFTAELIQKIRLKLHIVKNTQPLYDRYPFYKISSSVYRKDPTLARVTYNNLSSLASCAFLSNIKLFCYLQPHALSGKKRLTENENRLIDNWFQRARYAGDAFKKERYEKLMNFAFNELEAVYAGLGKKFEGFPGLYFYSLTGIFTEEKRDAYLDTIHYTKTGNEILASRFFKDLTSKELKR